MIFRDFWKETLWKKRKFRVMEKETIFFGVETLFSSFEPKIRYYKDVTLGENYVRDFFIAAILQEVSNSSYSASIAMATADLPSLTVVQKNNLRKNFFWVLKAPTTYRF
jgi:hypothetical protein